MSEPGAGFTALRAVQSVTSAINRAAGGRPIPGNQVTLLIDGPCAYDAMIELIATATRWIHFENYIIRGDRAGQRFAEALAARAREGVAVRLLYDSLGSFATPRSYWRRLREAGVEVRPFRPLAPLDLVGNFSRNHRKLVVADGARAVMGGLCIGCEWTGEEAQDGHAWRDTAVEIAGPPARIALALLPYAALGIEEFMISGIDRPGDIARTGRETITLLANSLARREAEVPQPGAFASSRFAEHRIG